MNPILKSGLLTYGVTLSVLFSSLLCFQGCAGDKSAPEPPFLIKSGSVIITREDFIDTLDLKKAAYSYDIDKKSSEYNPMVMDLVKTLSDEAILLNAAQHAGITVTDTEKEIAENQFENQFPEGGMDKEILKNAISVYTWEKRFLNQIIIEKLIQRELIDKMQVTPKEIFEFYNTHKPKEDETGNEAGKLMDESELVGLIRREKAEEAYPEWMAQLAKTYPAVINEEQLKAILMDMDNGENKQSDEKS